MRNVGSTDKIIRLVAGIGLLLWAFLGLGLPGVVSTMGITVAVIGAVLMTTALLNFCPLFKLLGISSFRQN